jgi:hypothetical protein
MCAKYSLTLQMTVISTPLAMKHPWISTAVTGVLQVTSSDGDKNAYC